MSVQRADELSYPLLAAAGFTLAVAPKEKRQGGNVRRQAARIRKAGIRFAAKPVVARRRRLPESEAARQS